MTSILSKIYGQTLSKRVTLVATAGTSILPKLLGVSGASSTIMECQVPYSRASSMEILKGAELAQFCSIETAELLAAAAYERSSQLTVREGIAQLSEKPLSLLQFTSDTLPRCIGLACSAALVSGAPKRGDHRCFVAAYSAEGVHSYELVLEKGLRDRAGEDDIAAQLLLRAFIETW